VPELQRQYPTASVKTHDPADEHGDPTNQRQNLKPHNSPNLDEAINNALSEQPAQGERRRIFSIYSHGEPPEETY
jgi:hypothetical protein